MPQFQGQIILETLDLSQIFLPNLKKTKNATLINASIGSIFWNKNISCHGTFKGQFSKLLFGFFTVTLNVECTYTGADLVYCGSVGCGHSHYGIQLLKTNGTWWDYNFTSAQSHCTSVTIIVHSHTVLV